MEFKTDIRGYSIICQSLDHDGVPVPDYDTFILEDTGQPITWEEIKNLPCGYCNKYDTPEGHDGCLGTLPGVKYACCGHGVLFHTYAMMLDESCIYAEEAYDFCKQHSTDMW